jgi:hypothetical protein
MRGNQQRQRAADSETWYKGLHKRLVKEEQSFRVEIIRLNKLLHKQVGQRWLRKRESGIRYVRPEWDWVHMYPSTMAYKLFDSARDRGIMLHCLDMGVHKSIYVREKGKSDPMLMCKDRLDGQLAIIALPS